MLHLLIDTSVLRQDPQRKSASFLVVNRLGNLGELTTYIPYVVQREFLSQRENEYVNPIIKAKNELIKVSNKPIYDELSYSLKNEAENIDKKIEEVKGWVQKEFDYWCGHIGAEVYQVSNHHGVNVLDAYFSGEPPFKQVKNRADFPDAFIFESVKDIASSVKQLNVVIPDKKLREACEKIENIIAFENLDDFTKSEQCKAVLLDADASEHFDIIVSELQKHSQNVEKQAEKIIFDSLLGESFSDFSILDDNHEASISMFDVPSGAGLLWDEIEYYGQGIISIPFQFEMEALADYYIFKSDWYSLDDEIAKSISVSEYDNKHYFEAEEEFNLLIDGAISLTVDLSVADEEKDFKKEISKIIRTMKVEASEIDEISVIR